MGSIFVLAVEVYRAWPALWHYPDFPIAIESSRLEVFADGPVSPELLTAIGRVEQRLPADFSPPPVFICTQESSYRRIAAIFGRPASSQGLNIEPASRVFVNTPFIHRVQKRHGDLFPHSILAGDAAHIIYHELMHSWLADRLGWWSARTLPMWKQEGYCEFAAAVALSPTQVNDKFGRRLERFRELTAAGIGEFRYRYVEAQMLVGHGLLVRKMPLDSLFKSTWTLERAREAMQGD